MKGLTFFAASLLLAMPLSWADTIIAEGKTAPKSNGADTPDSEDGFGGALSSLVDEAMQDEEMQSEEKDADSPEKAQEE